MEIVEFEYKDLDIDINEIKRVLGYENDNVPEPFLSIINNLFANADLYCDIKVAYVLVNNVRIVKEQGKLFVNEKCFDVGKKILRLINGSEKIMFFLATVGFGLEDWSKRETEQGDMMNGYVIDLFASHVVEAAAEKIHKKLEQTILQNNENITNRYSPGYCEWDVAEQSKLFSFFSDKPIGISLSESSLMAPIKSVSGIIGIGKNAKYIPHTCNICNSETCLYRNIKNK